MSAKKFEDFEVGIDDLFDAADAGCLTTKLERRRRIEELEEEKRLREELCEFA
ncbi:PA3496 family putative envelope integrity protein [Legionella yabuuchiae]|uniref:PA3496 family putative envelope integrity protein n=1 Tax=Legionella yabuuchiae TaxID=376727 RepID=UPI0013EF9C45|nr:hypothetical protein [Legionella yabuuchiae]